MATIPVNRPFIDNLSHVAKGERKIICMVIYSEFINKMNLLIKKQFYFNKAEIIRRAIHNYLESNTLNLYTESTMSSFGTYKKATRIFSMKYPANLLNKIDEKIKNSVIYESRSHFINQAMRHFFISYETYHKNFQNDKIVLFKSTHVTTLKISVIDLEKIIDLIKKGYFYSVSEFYRISIEDFGLRKNHNIESFSDLQIEEKHIIEGENDSERFQTCFKHYHPILELIDLCLEEYYFYKNQTYIIRIAIKRKLEEIEKSYKKW